MQATRVLLSFLVFDTLNNRQSIERTAYMPRGTFGPGDSSSLRLTSDLQYMGGAGGGFFCSVLLRGFISTISPHSFPNTDDLLTNFFDGCLIRLAQINISFVFAALCILLC